MEVLSQRLDLTLKERLLNAKQASKRGTRVCEEEQKKKKSDWDDERHATKLKAEKKKRNPKQVKTHLHGSGSVECAAQESGCSLCIHAQSIQNNIMVAQCLEHMNDARCTHGLQCTAHNIDQGEHKPLLHPAGVHSNGDQRAGNLLLLCCCLCIIIFSSAILLCKAQCALFFESGRRNAKTAKEVKD